MSWSPYFVSIGLSLVLVPTHSASPADLADAAELGRDKNASKIARRAWAPDLGQAADETGPSARLSGMVRRFTNRIGRPTNNSPPMSATDQEPARQPCSAVAPNARGTQRGSAANGLLEVDRADVQASTGCPTSPTPRGLDTKMVKERGRGGEFDLVRTLQNIRNITPRKPPKKASTHHRPLSPRSYPYLGSRGTRFAGLDFCSNHLPLARRGDAVLLWTPSARTVS